MQILKKNRTEKKESFVYPQKQKKASTEKQKASYLADNKGKA